jgi:hypothetical protein
LDGNGALRGGTGRLAAGAGCQQGRRRPSPISRLAAAVPPKKKGRALASEAAAARPGSSHTGSISPEYLERREGQ